MIHAEFKQWLQGYFALTDDAYLTPKQLVIVKNHATLVKTVEGYFEPWIEKLVCQLDTWIEEETIAKLETLKELFWNIQK